MRRTAACLLLLFLAVASCLPVQAQYGSAYPQQTRATRKSARKQQKAGNKYSKQQQKAIKKSAKAQRKALKQARKRSYR
jgi:hypothetical protein